MCMGKRTGNRWILEMSAKGLRRLGQFDSLRRCGLYRRILKYKPQGNNGGTVEPPCDFQKWSMDCPVNKGIPP